MAVGRYWILAGAILAGALAFRIAAFVGVRSVEPVLTAHSALQLSEGRYTALSITPGAVNNARLGMVAPTAAAVRLWGVNDVSCTLWPLLCGMLLVAAPLVLARDAVGDKAALIGAALLAAVPVDVLWSTQLYSDVPMSLCWAASGLLFWRALDRGSAGAAYGAGAVAGLSWLMREPGPLILGVLLAWALLARAPRMFFRAAAAALPVLLIESIGYLIATGDPLFRFGIMTQGIHNRYMTQDYYLTAAAVVKRIVLDLPSMMLWPGDSAFFYTGGLAVASAGAAAWIGRAGWKDPANRRLALWFAVIAVAFALIPLRLVPFRPAMVLHPRTLSPLMVPLALFLGKVLAERRWALAAIPLVLSASGVWTLAPAHRDAGREAREAAKIIPPGPILLTDDVLSMGGHEANFLSFDRGFDPRMDVRSLATWDPSLLPGSYVLVDTATLGRSKRDVLHPPETWRRVYHRPYGRHFVAVYQVGGP